MVFFKKTNTFFSLLKDAAGRNELTFRFGNFLWPLLFWLALIYRKFFLKKVKIIVVVGSLGKTTTVSTLKYLFGIAVKDEFESNAFSAVAMEILRLKSSSEYSIIEVGIAQKGDMKRYAKMICPNVVVITSIASDHSAKIGDLAAISKEKSLILNGPKSPEAIFINADDANVVKMVENFSGKIITYGLNQGNKYRCVASELNWPDYNSISIQSKKGNKSFQVSLFGAKIIYCFLAAFAAAVELNIPLEKIKERTAKIRPVNGRMQVVKLENGAVLIRDDFKSSIESNMAAIHFLNEVPAKQKIIVLGNISHIVSHARQKYKEMGFEVGKVADRMYVISSKDFEQALTSSAKNAGLNGQNITKTKNNWTKIPALLKGSLQKGDVVLIKGQREQHLERLSLKLMKKEIKCTLKNCDLKYIYCKDCSRLNEMF